MELGFGSGLNVPFYSSAVTSVAAIEPADLGWKLAGKRLEGATVPIERSGLEPAPFPLQLSLTRPLQQAAAAQSAAESMFLLAGQGAALARELPAGELVGALVAETSAAITRLGG